MKLEYLLLLPLILLLSCQQATKKPTEAIPVITCDNGYSIKARYYEPDSAGILSKLDLAVTKNGKTEKMVLYPAISASGSRFATPDLKQVFWEHQNEFYYLVNDSLICTCKGENKNEPH